MRSVANRDSDSLVGWAPVKAPTMLVFLIVVAVGAFYCSDVARLVVCDIHDLSAIAAGMTYVTVAAYSC